MTEPRHARSVALTFAVCCGACSADASRVAVHGLVGDTAIDTTVDSELARYFIERHSPGVALDPELEARIQQARAELKAPGAAIGLPRIARETSADLATLLLAEALLEDEGSATIRRLYAEELDQESRGSGTAVDRDEYGLLFAPGWLYRSHPENGAGFERQLALAAAAGIHAERLDTDENASVEHNAQAIADAIRRRRKTGRKYIVVSASKSGPEVALALTKLSAEEAAHVVAWVNIAGVLGGSPLADAALEAPRCWAALALFGWRRWGFDGMRSMATHPRRAALGGIRLPEHVLVVNYVPVPLSGQISRRARGAYEDMRSLGPNDGLALTVDEIFPAAATLVELGLDHYMTARDIDRRTLALTRAVVRATADRASAREPGVAR